ncbi:S8 family serine peptidase [Candidatus Daviesbacteria bacterium]|nr:S8 family serine peptidase [Candidatus Daviesbacteria bacterium]
MPKLFYLLSLFLIPLLIFSLLIPSVSAQNKVKKSNNDAPKVADELIIKFKENKDIDENFKKKHQLSSAEKIIKRQKQIERLQKKIAKFGVDRIYKAKVKNQQKLDLILRSLNLDPDIEYAEPNYLVSANLTPNDPDFSKLWGLKNSGQTGGTTNADIGATVAWDINKDSNVVVGVIDTGVDYNHPDLAGNIWTNPGEIAGNNIDDDNNGFVDDIRGFDFVNNDPDPMDDHGHGTHVAGTIGASGNNNVGITGVNWSIKIASLKFLSGSGFGSTTDAIEAIEYANLMGIKITNNSWGGGGYSQALFDAISSANGGNNLFIAAAGNNGANNDASPHYPSSYDSPNVVSVAATDHNDQLASFSNYGASSVDLAAPGVSIYSTVPTGSCSLCSSSGYRYLNGTSMATPHVAGVAALLWSTNSGSSNQDIKNKLLASTTKLPSLQNKVLSAGRLSASNLFEDDSIAPSPITNLNVLNKSHNFISLGWSATGDDGNSGIATSYDLRYSTSLIDENNFSNATPVANPPSPLPAGSSESFKITGLNSDTLYYFAIQALDNKDNRSSLSNVVSDKTKIATKIYEENFENGVNNWITEGSDGNGGANLWHLSSKRSSSPSNAWYYGKEATSNYDSGFRNFGYLTSPEINLASVQGSLLSFNHFLATENSSFYDKAALLVSNNNGASWTSLFSKSSTNGSFIKESVDLSMFDGSKIKLRFSFDTIDSLFNNFEGWFVDDVLIQGTSANLSPIANAGPDKEGITNQQVSFSGSLSSDPDGSIDNYQWDFGDGSTGSGVDVTHTYTQIGTYNVNLTVTDNGGLTASDSAVMIIKNPPVNPINIFSESFEAKTWTNWTQDSQKDWARSNQRKIDGKYSAEIDGSANNSQLISKAINLQNKTNADISFSWYIESGLDLGEYIAFDISTDNGASWQEKARLRGNQDPENSWQQINLNLSNINNLKLRFRGTMSSSSEDANLDNIIVIGQ